MFKVNEKMMFLMLERYPHLKENEINYIVKESEIISIDYSSEFAAHKTHTIKVNDYIKENFKVDKEIPLISNENGILWTVF